MHISLNLPHSLFVDTDKNISSIPANTLRKLYMLCILEYLLVTK